MARASSNYLYLQVYTASHLPNATIAGAGTHLREAILLLSQVRVWWHLLHLRRGSALDRPQVFQDLVFVFLSQRQTNRRPARTRQLCHQVDSTA